MSESEPIAPESWKVNGNMAPKEVSAPTSTSVFTASHTTLTIESPVIIDRINLIPVKSVPNW